MPVRTSRCNQYLWEFEDNVRSFLEWLLEQPTKADMDREIREVLDASSTDDPVRTARFIAKVKREYARPQ